MDEQRKIIRLLPGQILRHSELQIRTEMNAEVLAEYANLLRSDPSFEFPPVHVFSDGESYWLADGFHRAGAYGMAERCDGVPAIVHQGTKRDALKYALSANTENGLRRTRADVQRAIKIALEDPEWGQGFDREIAKLCDVDHKTVAKHRSLGKFPSENQDEEQTRTYTTKHGTRAKMKTKKVSRKKVKTAASHPAPEREPGCDDDLFEDDKLAVADAPTQLPAVELAGLKTVPSGGCVVEDLHALVRAGKRFAPPSSCRLNERAGRVPALVP
jgi:hypothetical protein